MAIRYVDVAPEGEGKPKQADAPLTTAEAERPGVSPVPYVKPAPKRRGRK